MGGNLVPVTKSGEQLYINFHAFRENRLPMTVRVRDGNQEPIGRIAFMREPKVARGEAPQTPICNLNLNLPDLSRSPDTGGDLDPEELKRKYELMKSGVDPGMRIFAQFLLSTPMICSR
jgi:ankyrin